MYDKHFIVVNVTAVLYKSSCIECVSQ